MLYCNELPLGIISSNCLLNIETINIISSYDDYYYNYLYESIKDDYYAETPNLNLNYYNII